MKFSTKAIHIGQEPDKETGAVIPPIYMTSTYVQEAPNTHKGYDYTRAGNPNFTNLEATLASLEQGKVATVFTSGIGATTALVSSLAKDDKVVIANDLYGGTYRLFSRVFSQFGIDFSTVDTQDLAAVEEKLKSNPKLIFLESPTNPLLRVSDLEAITTMAKKHNVLTVVDNTFATPYFQNPLTLGADFVMHSTTKYIGGHSDVIGGVVVTNHEEWKEKLDFARMAIGLNPSPFDNWMTTRGIKTLGIRMERHAANATKVAAYFNNHPKVKKVFYPGLTSHPNHDVAKKQMNGYSGIVSVEFDLSLEQSMKLVGSFKLFALAESLGGVESLVDHPASMTHASIPKEEREKNGLSDGLIRFSCGIEDVEDLIEDLDTVLKQY
jgi:cysteine-S-conjugate beta-lyase